jgi:hypothetical protein
MKTSKRPQYLVLIGIGVLTIVILVLVSSPSSLFSPMTVISDEFNKSSPHQVSVITKTDFSSPEQTKKFPYDIGKWHGQDYDTASVTRELGANVVLLRGYDPETFTQPLFLNIVQSKTDSSFHQPTVCFKLQGYDTEEQSKETLVVTSANWIKEHQNITITMNKILFIKVTKDGKITERRLVVYFYVKGNQFNNDLITMIEVQGLVPLKGSYEGTLKEEKEFLSQSIPLMFEPIDNNSQWHPFIASLAEKGAGGYIVAAIMIIIPLGIIFYPLIRRRGPSNE